MDTPVLQLKEGTAVFTSGGERIGEINRVVLDPATHEVTHIAVKKGWLLHEEKLVPMAMVRSADGDRAVLEEDARDLDKLPPFKRNVPGYAVALKEGADVISSDGKHVGHIERLLLEADSDKVSGLLVSYGLIPVRKLVPSSWLESVEERSVHLTVPAGVVEGLRVYEP